MSFMWIVGHPVLTDMAMGLNQYELIFHIDTTMLSIWLKKWSTFYTYVAGRLLVSAECL